MLCVVRKPREVSRIAVRNLSDQRTVRYKLLPWFHLKIREELSGNLFCIYFFLFKLFYWKRFGGQSEGLSRALSPWTSQLSPHSKTRRKLGVETPVSLKVWDRQNWGIPIDSGYPLDIWPPLHPKTTQVASIWGCCYPSWELVSFLLYQSSSWVMMVTTLIDMVWAGIWVKCLQYDLYL